MTYAANPASAAAGYEGRYLSQDALVRLLAEHYAIEVVRLTPLGGETDQNLRVQTSSGTTWFARLSAAAPEEMAWQNSILEHLAQTAPGLPVPFLLRTTDGKLGHLSHTGDSTPVTLRVMSWMPGRTMAEAGHHPTTLLHQFGLTAGRLSAALSTMAAPLHQRTHDWDMRAAREAVAAARSAIEDPAHVANVDQAMAWYDRVAPGLGNLPQGVVHHDLNDANVLVGSDSDGELVITGIVDVGDALHSARVTELAIAVAYAMVAKDDPLGAATAVIAGFNETVPLSGDELCAVYPLALARLCMNASTWSRRVLATGSAYGRARMHDTWPTLAKCVRVHPDLAEETFRIACGLPATSGHAALSDALATPLKDRGACTLPDNLVVNSKVLDLQPASDLIDDLDWTSPGAVQSVVEGERASDATHTLVLPHLRSSMLRAARRAPGVREPATVQLGAGLLLASGDPVCTPLPSTVEAAGTDDRLVLRHDVGDLTFRTVWHGLRTALVPDAQIDAGDLLGVVDIPSEAGTAAGEQTLGPGIQLQVVTSADLAAQVPRFVPPSQREAWHRVSPDPAPLLGLPVQPDPRDVTDVLTARRRHLASSQRNYYIAPMNLVRGRDVWFYDENALGYLDSLNNVTHVGHAEPRVSGAAFRQLRKLNTNSRFVYPQIAEFAEKLVATLPDPLQVVFLVCTGSEANDLAMRISCQVTGRQHIVNIDGAYHGNTGWVTGISPNRYKGPGGQGAPSTTHEATIPDRYRGAFGYGDQDAGSKYAASARSVIDRISSEAHAPAAFIAESLMGSAGNIVYPPGYLSGAFAAARAAGALCISDEVQVGVGRLGPWWGFELQGVVPDIVTMGKPLGNGHPLAAVVTTREIADAFDTGMKYFNTFGGNPVSCAIGSAVLDVVEGDGLRQNAVEVGHYFAEQLHQLAVRQELIGDVRAEGLYLGVELVRDRVTKEPARREAFAVTELTKERGVVVFPNGVHDNVLKIKPPMTFTREHVDVYVEVLDKVLSSVDSMRIPADGATSTIPTHADPLRSS